MTTYDTSGNYGLRALTGANVGSDIDAGFDALRDDVASKMVGQSSGPIGSIPTSTVGTPGIVGREYYATDTKQWLKDYGTGWREIGTFTGEIRPTARPAAPTGWLLCDGATVSRTTYADLFAAIGTAYGAGDGSTTFGLPDLRGRVPVGVDGAAARLDANDALGQSGGEQKHALTPAEAPPLFNAGAVYANGVDRTAVVTTTGANGTAHNNMQPYQVVNYLIKA